MIRIKYLNRAILFSIVLVLASCQDESINEEQQNQQAELNFKDGNVISDGLLENEELMFNEQSDQLTKPQDLFLQKSSNESTPEIDYLVSMLPSQVTVTTTSKPDDNAYFNLTIDDSSDFLSGTEIPAWCADVDLGLDNNETASFDVYSSYGELPEGKFEKPENFDKVNWLLNQSIIGEESANGLGEYTFGHVQYAIWLLIDDSICQICTFLTNPTSTWNTDGNDVAQAEEIRDLALAQGSGFKPSVGELLAIVLVPDGRQSVIIGKEVEAIPCDDCVGKVTDLTLQWNWHNDHRVRVFQRFQNTRWATKVFDSTVGLNDEISVTGANRNGTFGKWLYIFVGNCYYTKIKTNCDLNIGPGYKRGVLEVVNGQSSQGGELCEYITPADHCWWW
jgi:hypothetical protein